MTTRIQIWVDLCGNFEVESVTTRVKFVNLGGNFDVIRRIPRYSTLFGGRSTLFGRHFDANDTKIGSPHMPSNNTPAQ